MRVQGVAQHVEFLYTDISAQLVGYGRKTYGAKYPFARFKVLVRHKLTSTSGCQASSHSAQSGFTRASWRSELAARLEAGVWNFCGGLHTDLRVTRGGMRRCWTWRRTWQGRALAVLTSSLLPMCCTPHPT